MSDGDAPADDLAGGTAQGATRAAAVVIGRNEGVRLIACLESLSGRCAPLVYVDSGSSDDSVAAAAARGAEVVALDMNKPFTAARARNAGLARIGADAAPYVQFVDGDCIVELGWIETAADFLDDRSDVAAVAGRLTERFPEATVYNRLCAIEWQAEPGASDATGGIAMMRRHALAEAGGFNETMIAGEEPELCLRLARAGWAIWRLDHPMALHDAAMARFGQFWMRSIRAGWAALEGALMHGGGPERYNRARVRSTLIWGLAMPLTALAGGLGGIVAAFAGLLSLASASFAVASLAVALAALQMVRLMQQRLRRGDGWRIALAFAWFTMVAKPAQVIGMARLLRRNLRGGTAGLIEYRRAG
ncbi:MAG: glycosyltransferase [Pseudomonadota bacterium]